jgi:3-oxoacyl-[acyl-carrier protein] reductase
MILKDKVAIVTGAANGIGRAIAEKFAEEGAGLALVDISKSVDETAEAIRSTGVDVVPVTADVAKADDVKKAARRVLEHFGSVDILVNNAGAHSYSSLVEISEEEWNRVMNVNAKGTLFWMQVVARHMIPRKRGKIINISSVSAIIPGVNTIVYCASKTAIIQMTRVAALELAPYGICVNAVCPGTTETDIVTNLFSREILEDWKRSIPMKKFPEVKDHADLVAFLASSAADCITGQFISVDCGQLLNFAQP